LLWQSGALTNREIEERFGISYTAVSHIVKEAKDKMKAAQGFQKEYARLNSQIKM